MDKSIETYMNYLNLGNVSEKYWYDIGNYIDCLNSDFIIPNIRDVATLFLKFLQIGNRKYKNPSTEIVNFVLKIFRNVAQSGVEDNLTETSLTVIWFLNHLYQRRNQFTEINVEFLASKIDILLESLEEIQFIFKFEIDGKSQFPLRALLAQVISDENFFKDALDENKIRMLRLATQLFEIEEERKVLEVLSNPSGCNLRVLEYLDGSQSVIDDGLKNYSQNKVMAFYSPSKGKVLIRHEDKSYFQIEDRIVDDLLQEERDYSGMVIGYYIEEDLQEYSPITIKDAILEHPYDVLELIFKGKCKNIFLDKNTLFYNSSRNHLRPANSFCCNDKYIVYGNGKNDICLTVNVLQCLQPYYINRLNSDLKANFILFGLLCILLDHRWVDFEILFSNSDCGDWLQNVIIKNWILAEKDKVDDELRFVLQKWCLELECLTSCQDIETKKVESAAFLPLKITLDWIYDIIRNENKEPIIFKYRKRQARSEAEVDTWFLQDEETMADILGNLTPSRKLQAKQLVFEADEMKNSLLQNDFLYVMFKQDESKYEVKSNQDLIKCIVLIETIVYRGIGLDFEIDTAFTGGMLRGIIDTLQLHSKGINSIEKVSSSFEAMAMYRLLYNMAWSRINATTAASYYKIFNYHQKLDFADIWSAPQFKMSEEEVLYVPKDNFQTDAVLSSVYHESLYHPDRRNERTNYYNDILTLSNDGKYCYNGHKIKKVCFITDNFEGGNGTFQTIYFYFDIKNKEGKEKDKRHFQRLQHYRCSGEEIYIPDILNTNGIDSFDIHSYYGTEEGKEQIAKKLVKNGFFSSLEEALPHITYTKPIFRKGNVSLKEWVSNIWGSEWADIVWKNQNETDFYTVVRKYNLTKKNIFPDAMISDPQRAITLFLKKDEE